MNDPISLLAGWLSVEYAPHEHPEVVRDAVTEGLKACDLTLQPDHVLIVENRGEKPGWNQWWTSCICGWETPSYQHTSDMAVEVGKRRHLTAQPTDTAESQVDERVYRAEARSCNVFGCRGDCGICQPSDTAESEVPQ